MYKIYTYNPEYPLDGVIHLYTYMDYESSTIFGVTILNDQLVSVVAQNDTNLQQHSNQTIELKSIRLNIHNCVNIYSRYIASLTVNIHCQVTKTYLGFQLHRMTAYSPKQCLLNDWDKFQAIHIQTLAFHTNQYFDTTKSMTLIHKKNT
jgi:hypothetical protein